MPLRSHKKSKRHQRKIAEVPGSLEFIGVQKVENPSISFLNYNEHEVLEGEASAILDCPGANDEGMVSWININGLHNAETIAEVGKNFNLHPLLLEDIMNTTQRPKADAYQDYLSLAMKMIRPNPESGESVTEQVTVIIGKAFVLTFQEQEGDVFDPIRDRIRGKKGRIRTLGPDYLAYALIDALVDHYFVVLEEFGDRVEKLEDDLLNQNSSANIAELQEMKREVIGLRKNIWPLREAVNFIIKFEGGLITSDTVMYLRDVYDHIIQTVDTIESQRDIVGGVQDLYMTVMNNKMNEVMKVLALISTIFLPLTLVAGIYGMNFEHMPELQAPNGYFYALGIMFIIGLGMYYYFKTRKWV